MANDIVQLVDSIASSPTLRLDLNDGTTWGCDTDEFDFSPPSLRRAINGTLLTDGSVQSASSYDNRVLTGTFEISASTPDGLATQMQLLHRELDREANFLKWQPNGATSPVFFRTLRTPPSAIKEMGSSGAYKRLQVSILAEPFALGLREDIAVGTFNNDPAAGSNGLFFDVTGVKGDVAAPIVLQDATALRGFGILGCRQHGTPSDLPFIFQAEAASDLFTDTTNPGGGPDAAMSGAGTNNFLRTSFATDATMLARWRSRAAATMTTAQLMALRGTYRMIACVRRSDTSSVINIKGSSAEADFVYTNTVTVPATTTRQIVDLGLTTIGGPVNTPGLYGSAAPVISTYQLILHAQRVSGAGTLDWDYVALVPADEQLLLWNAGLAADVAGIANIVDGNAEAVYSATGVGSGLFAGTIGLNNWFIQCSGGFPMVKPNQTNRFYLLYADQAVSPIALVHAKATTGSLTVSYWPRYLYARPATT